MGFKANHIQGQEPKVNSKINENVITCWTKILENIKNVFEAIL